MVKMPHTFGSHQHVGIGHVNIRIPISIIVFITFEADVVNIDAPLLLGLEVLTYSNVIVEFPDNEVRSKTNGLRIPLVRKQGHAYLVWTVSILYTNGYLRKIHIHFYRPHPDKFHAMMKRAYPEKVSLHFLADMESIKFTCDVRKREEDVTHLFSVSIPDGNCVFNRIVCIDLMYL